MISVFTRRRGFILQLHCWIIIGAAVKIIRLNSSMTEVVSYRNQSIDLQSKSMDWFLYDKDLHRERVKHLNMVLTKKNEMLVITYLIKFMVQWKLSISLKQSPIVIWSVSLTDPNYHLQYLCWFWDINIYVDIDISSLNLRCVNIFLHSFLLTKFEKRLPNKTFKK